MTAIGLAFSIAAAVNTFTDSARTALALISSFDATLWTIVGRSLAVSGTACLIGYGIGLLAGAGLGVARFRGRGVVLTVLNTCSRCHRWWLACWSICCSRSGPLGFLGWMFTFQAMVIAQVVLVVPVVTALTRQTVEDADVLHGEQLASLGAGRFMRGLMLAWDERYALLTVLMAAFGRAVSEVGAVMIVGGNIDGFTRVMTTAIALETSKGDLPLALGLGIVLLGVVLVLNALISLVRGWRERVDGVVTPATQVLAAA